MKSRARSWPVSDFVGRRTVPNFGIFRTLRAPSPAAIAVFLFANVAGGPVANAQTTIEVEKITCTQFLTFAVADPNQIGIWLSGYFHGRHGDKILRVQDLRKKVESLKTACYLTKNSELSVMEVSESLSPGK